LKISSRAKFPQKCVLDGAVVVGWRVVRAGLRLAQFLNDTFKD
jgi:hypothetical protein